MVSEHSKSVIAAAKELYAHHRESLEKQHRNRYVAIEPESGDFFLGDTFDEAVEAAVKAHPDRITHTIRIGHDVAFHIGLMEQ